MSKVTTSHYKIFDYWKDKVISPCGEVRPYSEKKDGDDLVILDWAETECWACGRRTVSPRREEQIIRACTIKKNGQENDFDFKKLWGYPEITKKYERCHIVPEALGGKDEPSNLFLLCPECHSLSPDTVNPASFFRWVYRKRKKSNNGWSSPQEWKIMLVDELESRGVSLAQIIQDLGEDYDYSGLKEYAKGKAGTHLSKLAESSIIAVTADFLIQEWINHQLA